MCDPQESESCSKLKQKSKIKSLSNQIISGMSQNSSGNVELHQAIMDGDIKKARELLATIPNDIHHCDADGNTAAAVALRCGQVEIYELLVSEGRQIRNPEQMDELLEGQKDKRVSFQKIHRKYMKNLNSEHVKKLISLSCVSHETPSSDHSHFRMVIAEAFEDLNSLDFIEPILKVASTASDLKIVFDFKRSSVEFMDPTKQRNVLGTTYPVSAYIYIGALGLEGSTSPEDEHRRQVLGVLAHELTHFVMQLVYENEAKPYQQGSDMMIKFSEVVDLSETKKRFEKIIKTVYEAYDKSRRHAELIVCVPQLIAIHKYAQDERLKISVDFFELFDFYENNTLIDLNRAYPMITAKQAITKVNELSGSLAKLKASEVETTPQALDGLDIIQNSAFETFFVESNCFQVTMRAIFQRCSSEIDFELNYLFSNLSTVKNERIFETTIKALKLCVNPLLIIDCEIDGNVSEIVQKLNNIGIDKKVVFISGCKFERSNNFKRKSIHHSWNHLTVNCQKLLLQKNIRFHGIKIQLGELLEDPGLIGSFPLNELIADQDISIGHRIEVENPKKLVERKLLPLYSELTEFERQRRGIEYGFEDILALLEDNQTFLLTGLPGMGKSTTMKMLQMKFQEKFSSSWVVFIDLKLHFQAFRKKPSEFHKSRNLVDFFSDNILTIDGFEKEVFAYLFNDNRVIFLFDGLDEICPSCKECIFGLMGDIDKLSANQLWVSTRIHLVEELREVFKKSIVFAVKPFTKVDRHEFIANNYSSGGEEIEKEIESFFMKMETNRWSVNPVENPQVIGMIIEIFKENLELSEKNLYQVYDQFTKKMIAKAMQKGQDVQKDMAQLLGDSKFVSFHTKVAFQAIFSNFTISKILIEEFDELLEEISSPSMDEISRVGLIFTAGPGHFQFIHHTFFKIFSNTKRNYQRQLT